MHYRRVKVKRNKICPKCGSNKIIIVPGKKIPAESGRSIMIGQSALSSAIFDRYICSECGYSEEYFDKENIDKLINKFGINN